MAQLLVAQTEQPAVTTAATAAACGAAALAQAAATIADAQQPVHGAWMAVSCSITGRTAHTVF